MNYKSKNKTRMTSLRIEEALLNECKKRGVNVSMVVNWFLRKYLYIQKHDIMSDSDQILLLTKLM